MSLIPTDDPQTSILEDALCPLCSKILPRPYDTQTVLISQLNPRFLRQVRKHRPESQFPPHQRVCLKDLYTVLQSRVEELLDEDQVQYAKLQDDAVRNIVEYEYQEENWQAQFDSKRTFGEKSADNVAKFGGSWGFVSFITGFIFLWAILNLILGNVSTAAWDPYPFILLNLFLSTIAALQAPVIMMSQNRQAQRDRLQNDYISKIILRAEHQTRHVNAKVDHLITNQWKRLLEIQEIQADLLQISLQQQQVSRLRPYMKSQSFVDHESSWKCELIPDDHALTLIRSLKPFGAMDQWVFSHWHSSGDNFTGHVKNVRLECSDDLVRSIHYIMSFSDPSATLDDVLSGEGLVTLRNDFGLDHMSLRGRWSNIEIQMGDRLLSFNNGDLPYRYKPSFSLVRADRISDFWKQPISQILFTYHPPQQVGMLKVPKGKTFQDVSVVFFVENDNAKLLYLNMDWTDSLPDAYDRLDNLELWSILAEASRTQSEFQTRTELTRSAIISQPIFMNLVGPTCCAFFSPDCRVQVSGTFIDT